MNTGNTNEEMNWKVIDSLIQSLENRMKHQAELIGSQETIGYVKAMMETVYRHTEGEGNGHI